MNSPKVVSGFVGYIKQLMDMDTNGFKPDLKVTATRASYFFAKERINAKKRKIMQGYKDRDTTLGRNTYILNIEELATLWHFPIEASVKAPLIQKAPGRKAEPPITLPLGSEAVDESFKTQVENFGEEDIFTLRDSLPLPADDGRKAGAEAAESERKTDIPSQEKQAAVPSNLPFAD
jgi:hypothetical protein